MGVGDSAGRIHDFNGPYSIGVDNFMVGTVWRYVDVGAAPPPAAADGSPDLSDSERWDAAVERADAVYRKKMHNICCENCHHHSAMALTEYGKPHDLLSSWFLCCLHGRCTWWHCLY
jgi:hypothetical protein